MVKKMREEKAVAIGLLVAFPLALIIGWYAYPYLYDSYDTTLFFTPPKEADYYSKHYQSRTMFESKLHDVIFLEPIPENHGFIIRAQNGLDKVTFNFNYYHYNASNDQYILIGSEMITFNLKDGEQI